MTSDKADNRVFIRFCEDYDRKKIRQIVADGMQALNFHPKGKLFVKPNVVYASKKGRYGATAYTHPSLVGASLLALSHHPGVRRIDMGEKTAIGYPTRLSYKYAGYYTELRAVKKRAKAPVKMFCIDEDRRDRVFVGGAVHDTLRVPRKMARADARVYLPKLKCHCVSTMTGAVKLNIGICSDDERAIRHDFMLNDKIVDLLAAGTPDFIIMDAIDVGVGNEAFPTPRRLGLILMGKNPLAVGLAGARLLGYDCDDVPYLRRAVERGYLPGHVDDTTIIGDLSGVADLDRAARRILPYDDEFVRWQDINKELTRMASPIRFFWGVTGKRDQSRCATGCVMGAKMFFGFLERFAGPDAFRTAKPVVMVIGKIDDPIDARGEEAFLIGSCAAADIVNARKITRIDNCFTTAVDMAQTIRGRLGMPTPILSPSELLPLLYNALIAASRKIINLRYLEDMGHFMKRGLQKRI
jgi:uncharacterized protein (DUF362 family)